MSKKQAKVRVTVQQLELLLENWGLFAATGTWGPKLAVECGSADRQWNDHSYRYVWDEGGRPSRRAVADDALGLMVERLEDMPGVAGFGGGQSVELVMLCREDSAIEWPTDCFNRPCID